MTEKIFGTSGIRGGIDEKVTVDLAMRLGRGLGTYLKGAGIVGVGTDARTSNQMLKNAFVSGVISTGTDIIDLGNAPMPTVASHSAMLETDVSVVITASHNPPTDNGFKFFKGGREFVRKEEVFLEERVRDGEFISAEWNKIGRTTSWDIRPVYFKRVHQFLSNRGDKGEEMPVLIDAANGAACYYTPHLLRELGFKVTTINSHPDGHFPGRLAEPSPRNLGDIMQVMKDSDFAVGIAHDGDGDRLAVIDEKGRFIDQNRIIALFARDEIERKGGGTVVVSIDTSSVIDELVKKTGGRIIRAPLGSLQEKFVGKHEDIIFASEPWKPIFMELGMWMDGITGAARISQMIHEHGDNSCIELMKSVPEYPMLRENVPCPDEIKPKFLPRVQELLVDEITGIESTQDDDGIRINREDGSYVLVRVSGTEPKARLYIGAKTERTLNELEKKTMDIMKRVLDELQS